MFRFLPCCSDSKNDIISGTILKNKIEPETEKVKDNDKEDKNEENKVEIENKLSDRNSGFEAKEIPAKSVRQSGEQEADQVASNQKLAFVT
ncbi:Hypothetical protein SRAE_2000041400 [Strongyloides ratti]|uniref:Uncharacterized protein n=1 Tax=Strongyloides ratti TaxID=34506 RepID=A0A090LCB7_STRRB|nr:Hypothetical protein SRAE_2000041400 [Strongyloides ratti]CEF65738.1 Hypothetical protein SRAE_2000041400 [Strongyloides ratti]